MGITLEQLKAGKSSVVVAYGDESLTITYRAGDVTPAWARSIDWLSHDAIVASFVAVVVDWDITTNGAPLAITKETVEQLPRSLVSKSLSAIVYDVSPKKSKSAI